MCLHADFLVVIEQILLRNSPWNPFFSSNLFQTPRESSRAQRSGIRNSQQGDQIGKRLVLLNSQLLRPKTRIIETECTQRCVAVFAPKGRCRARDCINRGIATINAVTTRIASRESATGENNPQRMKEYCCIETSIHCVSCMERRV